MLKVEELLKKLLKAGITVELILDEKHDTLQYSVGGFYKSGDIKLFSSPSFTINEPDRLYALARYDEITPIHCLQDLFDLNLEWYNTSKDRYEGWKYLDHHWKILQEQEGLDGYGS